MEQLPLRLLCRLDAPSILPHTAVAQCKTYRDAVRLCWDNRKVRNMTMRLLAERAGLYPPHVSQYLRTEGRHLRDLPGDKVRAFEAACDNAAVSQWHAMQGQLTVLEELQAERAAA
jgi:hypothetical protein